MVIMIVIIGLGVMVFGYSLTFPGADHFRSGNWVPGPAFFPRLLAVIIVLAAVIELIKEIRKRNHPELKIDPATGEEILPSPKKSFKEWISDRGTHNAIIMLGIMFALPFLLEPVGFAIMGFMIVFVITWRLRAGVLKSAIFAAVSVILTMFFFKYVFYTDLPPGVWSPTLMF